MRVIRGMDRAGERVVALGTFDGVHRGHRALLERAKAEAEARGCPLRVTTFDRHPLEVIAPAHAPGILTTIPEKAERMLLTGVDEIQVLRFDRRTASMPPEEFLQELRRNMTVRAVVAGWNYTFGRGAEGNADTLRKDGGRFGYDVLIEDAVVRDGQAVSSSRIRDALARGDLDEANDLLLEPYSLTCTAEGVADGRLYVRPADKKVLPAPGRYSGLLKTTGGYIPVTAGTGCSGDRIMELEFSDECPAEAGEKMRLMLTGRPADG